jgi:hypothetical protein
MKLAVKSVIDMNPDSDKRSSGEFCYRDADGNLRDGWIHEEVLDNPEADRALA